MMQFFTDVLIRTADLALIALSVSLVYGLVKFPNIAFVQYAMVGAYGTALLLQLGLPFPLALMMACILCGLIALILHRAVFTTLAKSGSANAMIGSLAVSMVITAIMLGVMGSSPILYNLPISKIIVLGDVRISSYQIVSTTISLLSVVLFSALLFRSKLGLSIRVLASNQALAQGSGVNAQTIIPLVNFIAGALAGLGGALLALNSSAYINQGNDLLLPVLAAAILGGLGNPVGAVAGAALIGLTETLATTIDFGALFGGDPLYIPLMYVNAISFTVLIVALLVRPHGLFSKELHRV
ncbi:branched-chain amino acid ABC transporter permease [Celerinatantimonas sp. YJH-8]|uniref:branched-chain amino acid ABC transporter permease n=1 Tax=Celerinatantimonas sp. YJH-8 TaxID=3228714 RepID=UPI0038C0646F